MKIFVHTIGFKYFLAAIALTMLCAMLESRLKRKRRDDLANLINIINKIGVGLILWALITIAGPSIFAGFLF